MPSSSSSSSSEEDSDSDSGASTKRRSHRRKGSSEGKRVRSKDSANKRKREDVSLVNQAVAAQLNAMLTQASGGVPQQLWGPFPPQHGGSNHFGASGSGSRNQ